MRQPLPVLLLLAALAGAGCPALAGDEPGTPAAKPPSATAISPPIPIGVEKDVYCTGWVDDPGAVFPASIFSSERVDSKQGLIEGDVVYMNAGTRQGIAAGQEYWVVRPDRTVYRPGSVLDVVGRVYLTPGRVRVLCAQEEAAIAEIVLSCSDVNIGDFLLPFEPIPVPLVRRTAPLSSCDPTTGKVTGFIVDDYDSWTPIMKDSVVYLNVGEDDGIVPGDFFSVYRIPSVEYTVRIMLGEAAILSTKKRTSVAIITSMRDTMYVGDHVEMK